MYKNVWRSLMANSMPSRWHGRKQTRMAHDSTLATPMRMWIKCLASFLHIVKEKTRHQSQNCHNNCRVPTAQPECRRRVNTCFPQIKSSQFIISYVNSTHNTKVLTVTGSLTQHPISESSPQSAPPKQSSSHIELAY
ncbi:hypothetical protein Bbelb_282650 [Branchiostoma belcheri]|nr:hypothetical protein Bbelb_282650 [Branchiostoma belcheri]